MIVCPICHNLTLKPCCEASLKKNIISLSDVQKSSKIEAKNLDSNTTQVNCSKCSSNNVQVKILQNRSADESATMRIECLNCGARESV
jgi:DNA-directed RNA polymerase subunit M/transcription elongation factor TFIIS